MGADPNMTDQVQAAREWLSTREPETAAEGHYQSALLADHARLVGEVERLNGDVGLQANTIRIMRADAERAAQTQAHTEGLWHMEEGLRLSAEAKLSALEGAARKGRQFAVLFLAFDGRDRGTERMNGTLDGLCKLAVEAAGKILAALSAASPSQGVEAGKPEKQCENCGGHNPVWFAPNHIWNTVMGGPDAKGDPGGMLCPVCFIGRAEKGGLVPTAWVLRPEQQSSSKASHYPILDKHEAKRVAAELSERLAALPIPSSPGEAG